MKKDVMNEDINDKELPLEKVPVFRNWGSWYALVIGFLILLIGCFYFLTKHFS